METKVCDIMQMTVPRTEERLQTRRKHPVASPTNGNQLSALGWTEQEIDETRSKLSDLDEEWNDPSMDAYDKL
jgi:hypothetical protein